MALPGEISAGAQNSHLVLSASSLYAFACGLDVSSGDPALVQRSGGQDAVSPAKGQFTEVSRGADASPADDFSLRQDGAHFFKQGKVRSLPGAHRVQAEEDEAPDSQAVHCKRSLQRIDSLPGVNPAQQAGPGYIKAQRDSLRREGLHHPGHNSGVLQSFSAHDNGIHTAFQQGRDLFHLVASAVQPQFGIELGSQVDDDRTIVALSLDGVQVGQVDGSAARQVQKGFGHLEGIAGIAQDALYRLVLMAAALDGVDHLSGDQV